MKNHVHSDATLTENQSLVINTLSKAKSPLSAYTILDELREDGFKAPLQVYRALDKLIEFGLVHRLESLNAFVACQHPACNAQKRKAVMFTICKTCGNVQELMNETLQTTVTSLAKEIQFTLGESVIELRGICSNCKED